MKTVLISLAVLAASTSLSTAADLMMDPAPVIMDEAMFDWTGFYVGAHGGWAAGTVRMDEAFCIDVGECGDPSDPENRYFSEPDVGGWFGGAHVGAAVQYDQIVLGVETDANFSDVSGDAGFSFYDAVEDETFPGREGETAAFSMLWDGSARVKIGFAVDRFMPYATAGIAYGQAEIDTHRINGPDGDTTELDFNHEVNLIGYTVGIGAAYAATDNIVLHAEGRYTEYGEIRSHADSLDDGESLIVNGPQLFSVRGGVSFKF